MASSTYHGFGQRVLKAFPGGTGEIYPYGQNRMLLEETDPSGTPQADSIYLNGSNPCHVESGATLNPATGTLCCTPQREISRFCWLGCHKFSSAHLRRGECRAFIPGITRSGSITVEGVAADPENPWQNRIEPASETPRGVLRSIDAKGTHGELLMAIPNHRGAFEPVRDGYSLTKHDPHWTADEGSGGYAVYHAIGRLDTHPARLRRYYVYLVPDDAECTSESE